MQGNWHSSSAGESNSSPERPESAARGDSGESTASTETPTTTQSGEWTQGDPVWVWVQAAKGHRRRWQAAVISLCEAARVEARACAAESPWRLTDWIPRSQAPNLLLWNAQGILTGERRKLIQLREYVAGFAVRKQLPPDLLAITEPHLDAGHADGE
eukprot:gene5319-4249_t